MSEALDVAPDIAPSDSRSGAALGGRRAERVSPSAKKERLTIRFPTGSVYEVARCGPGEMFEGVLNPGTDEALPFWLPDDVVRAWAV